MIILGFHRGDIVEIEFDDLAYKGEAVGHLEDGLAVFVAGGIPGEKARVRILDNRGSYLRGELVEMLESVSHRKEPECPVFYSCGGCQWQYLEYQSQLQYKRDIVEELLSRVGGLNRPPVETTAGCDYPWQYRNKAQFPLVTDKEGRIKTGFYKKGTHQVVITEDCPVQHPLINRIIRVALEALNHCELSVYDEQRHRGLLRHLAVRVGVCTNQAQLILVTRASELPHKNEIVGEIMDKVPELVGIHQNINPCQTNVIFGDKTRLLAGDEYFIDYIGSLKYRISPLSFFQVNTLQAHKLMEVVREMAGLERQEIVIDTYCGIGSIGLYLAGDAGRVIGIEEQPGAVEDARHNAFINGFDNCTFIRGRVETELPDLKHRGIDPDVIIVDPPRKGLNRDLRRQILDLRPEKVIYVSCNPSTLARDLARLAGDYQLKRVKPVDLFPQTYHIETVSLLQLIGNQVRGGDLHAGTD